MPGQTDSTAKQLSAEIAKHQWYHTLELAPGVLTPGWFDLRPIADRVPIPARLDGKRCLDVGTFDGFWAFEMERRGADEVVAIDILDPRGWDWPAGSTQEMADALNARKAGGSGFELARDALSSAVERREMSIYELDPEVVGSFDVVYVGSLLLHLRDPVGALQRVRSVCRELLVAVDAVLERPLRLPDRQPRAHLDARGRPWWWKPNEAGLRRMVEAAGFDLAGDPVRLRMPPGAGHPRPPLRPAVLRDRVAREAAFAARRGDRHVAIRAEPR